MDSESSVGPGRNPAAMFTLAVMFVVSSTEIGPADGWHPTPVAAIPAGRIKAEEWLCRPLGVGSSWLAVTRESGM
jgi:hypothetical protein